MVDSPDIDRKVSRLVAQISRLYSRDFAARVTDHGLTHTQWQALSVISHNEGINQAELAEMLNVKPMSLARLVDRMETAGWVERRRSPTDRRAFGLFLTTKVTPILAEMNEAGSLTREAALVDFDLAERELFVAMLERVKANLSATNMTEDGE